jgi:hypothetical protein
MDGIRYGIVRNGIGGCLQRESLMDVKWLRHCCRRGSAIDRMYQSRRESII